MIVTAHYVWEYNRRPLNNTQRTEVERMLSPYFLSEQARNLVPKSELSNLVSNDQLFWVWRYQKSVLDLAWAVYELYDRPGHVIVAELHGEDYLKKRVVFSKVPPPVEDVGECRVNEGEEPPSQHTNWGDLFRGFEQPLVFYLSAGGTIRYLRKEQGMAFDDRFMAPVQVSRSGTNTLPELRKVRHNDIARREQPWDWKWVNGYD